MSTRQMPSIRCASMWKTGVVVVFASVALNGAKWVVAAPSDSNIAPPWTPAALRDLKPGEWYEVPNSRLDAVAASEKQFPWLRGGIGGITVCWAGGAFDSQRDRLYLGPGGGHAGYNGNEIYAFDLHEMKWHRLNDPDPVIPGTEYTKESVAPFAMHTYDAVEYLAPPTDRYVVVGGWGTQRTYALNPDRPDHWEVYPDHGTGRTGDLGAYDPLTGLYWLSTPITSGKLSQWDPFTHRWTLRLNDSPHASYYETADIDWKRHLLVSCGKGRLKTWKLREVPGSISFDEPKSTGDTQIMEYSSPGFCYVPQIDRFVAWADGPDVYTLDIDAMKWTRHGPAETNKVIPGPPTQWGTFGRFRYVPSMNVFVLYNDVKQNVFVYRLTDDRPNVITAVEAKLKRPSIEAHIPAAAISVEALYADGTRKNVTDQAWYFSFDPSLGQVNLRGGGVVCGLAPGSAHIRAVYTDPQFKRGYSAEVALPITEVGGAPVLDSFETSALKLTLVVGDSFQLNAIGSYIRGPDHFRRPMNELAAWSSGAPDIVSISKGLVRAIHAGGPVAIKASFGGKVSTTDITVTQTPVIRRINFQVKDNSPRTGWECDNGKLFTAERGFGWLDVKDMATRDDRTSAHNFLLASFASAREQQFKVKTPPGDYVVRVAMGDNDYGAIPFQDWVAAGDEKMLYYEGQRNSIATRSVRAGNNGLIFTVKGPINYLIIAPLGIDFGKYADDAPAPSDRVAR